MPMLKEYFFEGLEVCARAVSDALGDDLVSSIASRGKASVAVSGGRTPRIVFQFLAARTLAWDNIFVTLTDERWVETDHADSNEKQTRDFLLQGNAKKACFTGMKTSHATPEAGLKACEERFADMPMPLDVVYLGMGSDGHIASLFPGSKALSQASGLCAATFAGDGRLRMSLSPDTLLSARHLILMFSGAENRAVYEAAKLPGPIIDLPVRLLLQQNRVPVTVFIN